MGIPFESAPPSSEKKPETLPASYRIADMLKSPRGDRVDARERDHSGLHAW
jgi:hypothetical protein